MSDRPQNSNEIQPTEVILFGLVPHGDQRTAPEVLEELQELADTGGFRVIGCVAQHRRSPDPNTYLGSGKLNELAELVKQSDARAVIADDPLSPSQGRNIERALGVAVLDRSELILHIFGVHARTPQARLQVELARLQYQLPRLKRMWTHLERQRGGIGVRGGAGEKQIDLDRSDLRARIAQLGTKLRDVQHRKTREVRTRADQFTIALVGYTNSGKSTLMNRLTEAGVLSEDRLFSTLDTRTRPWRLPGGRKVLLSDTVGFIRKLPHELVASFHATLEEALNADLLLLLVDASNPHAREHWATVEQVLAELGASHLPRIHVLNKLDRIADHSMLAALYAQDDRAVALSARDGTGIAELELVLQDYLAQIERTVEILIPHSAAALHHDIRKSATVLSEFYTEEGCLMELRLSPGMLGRLLARGAILSSSGS